MEPSSEITEELDSAPSSAADMPSCWRCRKQNQPDVFTCSFCGAACGVATSPSTAESSGSRLSADSALSSLIGWYAIILGLSVCSGVIATWHADDLEEILLPLVIAHDLIVSGLVIASVNKFWSLPRASEIRLSRLWGCLISLPILAAGLGLNFGYHYVLQEWLDVPVDDDLFDGQVSFAFSVVVVCMQPAIFEELFFRSVCWKILRLHVGPHSTVFITAVMFGMAHIGVPISVPALTMLGVAIGYSRLLTGGLALPMIFHFLHNLLVIWMADA